MLALQDVSKKGLKVFLEKAATYRYMYIHVILKNQHSKSYSKKVTGPSIFANLLIQKSTFPSKNKNFTCFLCF